jgi:hypothetical protein
MKMNKIPSAKGERNSQEKMNVLYIIEKEQLKNIQTRKKRKRRRRRRERMLWEITFFQ